MLGPATHQHTRSTLLVMLLCPGSVCQELAHFMLPLFLGSFEMGFLCAADRPGTCTVNQADLNFTEMGPPPPLSTGIKGVCITTCF